MFAARRPSFNALVQLRASKPIAHWLGVARMPSSKEMAIVSETCDPDRLRDCLGDIMHKLRRNKVLTPRHGLILSTIDSHETHSSYKRCHDVPRQFSWIDHRLVRDRHIQGRSSHSLALYLFLCTVADAQGLSYYSDTRLGEILGLSGAGLRSARNELRSAGLIAWQKPFYQVLSLEPGPAPLPITNAEPPRTGEIRSAAELMRAIMQEGLQ